MVAANGARLTKADHPALPVTLPEIVACAQACYAEGADGLHLHLRDADQGHLLDAGAYREALAELAVAVPDMAIQITTEAVGKYDPPHQRDIALRSNASLVSASVRELCRDPLDLTRRFYDDCATQGIAIQHILYDTDDCALLAKVLSDPLFQAPDLQLLFVLGRYSGGQQSDPRDLEPFLAWMMTHNLSPDWGICAFGQNETASLAHAAKLGGKCRLGFENSRQHADGTIAVDNASRVCEVRRVINRTREHEQHGQ